MKNKLHKYLPKVSDLTTRYKILKKIFGNTILHPDLWKPGQHGFSVGVGVGIFWCMIPIPFQMIMAALSSLVLRSNLPISLILCWITNPVTMPAIFYFNYRIGVALLGDTAIGYSVISNITDVSSLFEVLNGLWKPLYFGSFVLAVVLSISCYMLSITAWKLVIIRQWHNRNNRRRKGSTE